MTGPPASAAQPEKQRRGDSPPAPAGTFPPIARVCPRLADVLHAVADEAVLPTGFTLARPDGRALSCFLLLSGSAVVERSGHRHHAAAGSLLCGPGEDGRPGPPSGVTIWLAEPSRVLIIDPVRLAELIDADPTLADPLS